MAQWYSQRTSVLEVVGSIPAPIIFEFLRLKISHNLGQPDLNLTVTVTQPKSLIVRDFVEN